MITTKKKKKIKKTLGLYNINDYKPKKKKRGIYKSSTQVNQKIAAY